jgi:hypothetical protein
MLKKLRTFFYWRKIIDKNRMIIQNRFNLRKDYACRLYTVINVPEELVGDSYSLRKSDIDIITKNYVETYTKEVSKWFNENGLIELYTIYEIRKVEKYSWLIVIGFSQFETIKFYNRLYYVFIPLVVISSLALLLI